MENWRAFLSQYRVRSYAKGQIIICQDTTPNSCFFIAEGFVKSYLITAEGNEKPISFEGKNDIFPVDTAFGHCEATRYFYQAYTDCKAYQVPQADFLRFIEEHPWLFRRMFHYVLDRTLDSHAHISSLEQAKAADKLVGALHLLVRRFGKQVAKSRIRMTLPLTQQDLANFLGLTRETTGTQLKALERGGIVRYHRRQYVIDTDRLTMLIDQQ